MRLTNNDEYPLYLHRRKCDAVILGMKAGKTNKELKKAQELGIRVYSLSEYLYEHSKDKKRVVIGGSHGKTTITAMVLHVLKEMNTSLLKLIALPSSINTTHTSLFFREYPGIT